MAQLISFDNGSNTGLVPVWTGLPSGSLGIVAVHIPNVEGGSFNTSVPFIYGKNGKLASVYVPRITSAPAATGTYPGVTVGDLFGRATQSANLDTVRATFDSNYVVMQYLPTGSGVMVYYLYSVSINYIPRYQALDAVSIPVNSSISMAMYTGAGCPYILLNPLVMTITTCATPPQQPGS